MPFEGIKIAISMKQFKIFQNAERCNQRVNCFPNGDSAMLQRVKISGCANSEMYSRNIEDWKGQERSFCQPEAPLVTDSLQYFAQDQVR